MKPKLRKDYAIKPVVQTVRVESNSANGEEYNSLMS